MAQLVASMSGVVLGGVVMVLVRVSLEAKYLHVLNFNMQRQKHYDVTDDVKVNFLICRFAGCMKNMIFLANTRFYYP